MKYLMRFVMVLAFTVVLHNEPPRQTNAEFKKQEQVAVKVETPKPTEPPATQVQQVATPVEVKPPPAVKPQPPKPAPAVGSGCEWLRTRLAANGLTSSEIPAALAIAQKESGCRPTAVNPSGGACNVFQELPCGKWGGRSNVDAHIQGASSYAKSRYGGWQGAWSAWQAKHWW